MEQNLILAWLHLRLTFHRNQDRDIAYNLVCINLDRHLDIQHLEGSS